MMAISREQAVTMISQSYMLTRNAMRMMGIGLSSGFQAVLDTIMQTVQTYSQLATIAAMNPTTWQQSTLYYIQAAAALSALTIGTMARLDAMRDFAENQQLLEEINAEGREMV